MNDQMNEEPKVVEETVTEETRAADRSIADELTRLGKQVAEAVKAAWESDDRKKIQSEVTEGLQKFGQEVTGAFEKVAESEQAKDLRVKVEKVADDVAKSDVVAEVRKGVISGLEVVNRELSKLLERLESRQGGETRAVDVVDATPAAPTGAAPEVGGTPEEPKSEL